MMHIPVFNKDEIVNYAKIDEEDYEVVSAHRWHLSHGYAITNISHPCGGNRNDRPGSARMTSLSMHRLIVGLEYGDPKEPDHRNLDRLDNRKANLRVGTRALNNQNRKSHIGATSTLRGVSWNKARSKWQAQGCVGGVNKYLGLYEDEQEAGRVAAEWREKNLEFAVEILR